MSTSRNVSGEENSSDIVVSNNIVSKGSQLLNENDFFRDLCEIMEDPKFIRFFNKYFTNWTEIKSTVIFMKLHQELTSKYKELTSSNIDLDKSIISFIMWKIMRDKHLRPITIKNIDDYYNNPKKKIMLFNELENIITGSDGSDGSDGFDGLPLIENHS